MKKLFIFIYLVFLIIIISQQSLLAQDIIVLQNGEDIECKVISINDVDVNFSKYSNLEGPIYSYKKSEIFMIRYENGEKDVFKTERENISLAKEENKFSEFTDERDGKTYKTVKIGEQVWMAENLNYITGGLDCNGMDIDICLKCGQYYIYKDALIACPIGWHLPSDDEWMQLEMAVGMANVDARKSGWRGTPPGQAFLLLEGGNSGLDLGICGHIYGKRLKYYKKEAFYWTASLHRKKTPWIRHFISRASIDRVPNPENLKMSVRCIKDSK